MPCFIKKGTRKKKNSKNKRLDVDHHLGQLFHASDTREVYPNCTGCGYQYKYYKYGAGETTKANSYPTGLEGSKRSISDPPCIRWDVCGYNTFPIVSRIEFDSFCALAGGV